VRGVKLGGHDGFWYAHTGVGRPLPVVGIKFLNSRKVALRLWMPFTILRQESKLAMQVECLSFCLSKVDVESSPPNPSRTRKAPPSPCYANPKGVSLYLVKARPSRSSPPFLSKAPSQTHKQCKCNPLIVHSYTLHTSLDLPPQAVSPRMLL